MKWLAVLLLLAVPAAAQQVTVPGSPVDTSQFVTQAQAAAAAPVSSVNAKTGVVVVPSLCRQQSAALPVPSSSPATVSWTFPNTTCSFSTAPSCWMDMSTTSTNAVFDYPLNTARSTTAVTYSFTAHSNTLSILALGSLSLTINPPTNSTVTMTCTAPPA